jgi:hypothetical protein
MTSDTGIFIVKEVDLPEARIALRSDGLYHVHFKRHVVYDIPLQMRMRKIYEELTGGKRSKFIFSAEEGLVFTREARDNAEQVNANSPILCYALVVNSLAYKLIANFYLKVVKPKGLFKMVSSIREAARWLHSMPDQ